MGNPLIFSLNVGWILRLLLRLPKTSPDAAFFVGTIKFASWRWVWKMWALLHCKFFIWLALKKTVLDGGMPCKTWSASPCCLSLLWSGWWDYPAHSSSWVFTWQLWVLIFQHLHLTAAAPPTTSSHFSVGGGRPSRAKDMHQAVVPLSSWWPGKFGGIGILECLKVFCQMSTGCYITLMMSVATGAWREQAWSFS